MPCCNGRGRPGSSASSPSALRSKAAGARWNSPRGIRWFMRSSASIPPRSTRPPADHADSARTRWPARGLPPSVRPDWIITACPKTAEAAADAKRARQGAFARSSISRPTLGLNVVIHQRDAWEDTLAILRDYTGRLRGVFHCFGGTSAQADEVLGAGPSRVVHGDRDLQERRRACAKRQRSVPADRFMVETDCPYLAPVPFRGKRCEPAHTRETALVIAQARGESLETVAAQTTANAERFFRFDTAAVSE